MASTYTEPSPSAWTLRFKNRKTTVLLFVDPLHTFDTIKSHLVLALQETALHDPDTNVPVELPSSPSDIQLGRPVNIHDPSEGFALGEWEYAPLSSDEVAEGKGKGKAVAKGKGRPRKNDELAGVEDVKNCPKGAGLKDNAVLAFRFKSDGFGDEMAEDGSMWGVSIPKYEDAYGVENEGDVGGGREFEG